MLSPYYTELNKVIWLCISAFFVIMISNIFSWYHGKLDRRIAEERLLEVNVPGCFLVRESERKSGAYVLSFLSENSGTTHFR